MTWLWPPYYRCKIFYIVSTGERPDQLWDLNQTWPVGRKWCQFTNRPTPTKNLQGPPQIWGAKTSICWEYLRDFRNRHRISPKRNVASANKNATMCPLKVDLLSLTADPETAEIRLLIVTRPPAAITLQPS